MAGFDCPPRTIEDFDFSFQASVKQSLLGSFLGPELISEGRNLILCGPAGVGKTHLAIANRAIQNGSTAVFCEANSLIAELSEASARADCATPSNPTRILAF